MKRKSLYIILTLIMWILSFITIYQFTSETGSVSNQLSRSVAHIIQSVISDHFNVNLKDEFWSVTLNLIIRKCAHFLEFTMAGVTTCAFFIILLKNKWMSMSISFTVCSAMALLDEYHQRFVIGRTPRWFDVMIDTIGALFGILAACLFYFQLVRIIAHKQNVADIERKK